MDLQEIINTLKSIQAQISLLETKVINLEGDGLVTLNLARTSDTTVTTINNKTIVIENDVKNIKKQLEEIEQKLGN